ncbi:ribosomal RNA processing protein 36 homolog [Hippocampus zosterae]|uniref:ribosomal RNA processing protein 36 homolog n=1 Tax=Hippocampus zosterae TaxID=109293 RepID=UPI00223D6B86|nr:ribosomal RNA processing protein 36 homolog [Hippocampus zosterae]XP_051939935.1 ribosomal RNA processing protein 36 homolog [Hippocampus zosterae]
MAGGDEEESNSLALTERRREEEAADDDEDEEDRVGSAGSDDEEDDEASEEEEGHDEDGAAKVRPGVSTKEEDIKKELSVMSFEDILRLQSRVGTKAYNRLANGAGPRPPSAAQRKRLNKNRPAEVSAKKRAPFLRQVVAVKKATLRDPRFDDLSGEYKAEIFDKTYSFIHDIRRREMQVIQKQLKKTKDGDKREQLNFLLGKMADRERERGGRERRQASELQHKREQRERASRGARPYFVNKAEQKKMRLAASFSTLKTSGKLEAFLGKKRKRNAGKDRRKLPWQQQRQDQPAGPPGGPARLNVRR